MINPFQYGGVVGQEAFCNRKRELKDLQRAMENGERLFVYSERRMGKTSLVRLAMGKLPRKEYLTAYVDLWPTDGEASFATATAKAVAESMGSTADGLLQTAKAFFSLLAPVVSADNEGRPQLSFRMSRGAPTEPELEEVLSAPARIAAKRGCKVAMVFDEFQRIMEYGGDLVERKLRSVIQHHTNIAYIFLGSRKNLIQKMFLDQSRPLYRAGGHYVLEPIDVGEWLPFVRERFAGSNRTIADAQIESACSLTGGHPFYTQHLCHAIWELCPEDATVTDEIIEDAVQLLLDRETYAYSALWESLAINQRRFLKGLAGEPEGVKVFSAEFVQKHNLGSASNAQRAVTPLLEKDIIDRSNGSFIIVDRFFRIWINRSREA